MSPETNIPWSNVIRSVLFFRVLGTHLAAARQTFESVGIGLLAYMDDIRALPYRRGCRSFELNSPAWISPPTLPENFHPCGAQSRAMKHKHGVELRVGVGVGIAIRKGCVVIKVSGITDAFFRGCSYPRYRQVEGGGDAPCSYASTHVDKQAAMLIVSKAATLAHRRRDRCTPFTCGLRARQS